MKRPIALILAMLTIGGSVMARDNSYRPDAPALNGQKSPAEILGQTERGRELKNIVDMTMAGDKEGAAKAYEAYRRKYNPPPMGSPYPGSDQMATQPKPHNFGPPMTLPPEAR